MKPNIDWELNEYMEPLTKEENNYILPVLIKILKSEKYPITSGELCKRIDDARIDNAMLWKSKTKPPRIRKMMNWIRSNEILGVAGSVDGYLATDDTTILQEQIMRMEQRINAELNQLNGTKNYLRKLQMDESRDPLGIEWDENLESAGAEAPPVEETISSDNDDFWSWAGIEK